MKGTDQKNIGLLPVLILLLLFWGLAFFSSIRSAVDTWIRLETFTHCFLILPICIYLIHKKWHELNAVKIAPNYWMLAVLAMVLFLWSAGQLAQVIVVEQGAAFLALPMMIWAALGNQAARVLWFVLLFWMFSVPAGEVLVPYLQQLTADMTVYFLQMVQIPVYREGLYIAIPGGLFEVAVACSGIRYLIASVTLGALYAYLTYQKTSKRIIFLVFSLFLPILANGLRAFGIVIIAYLSEMKYATGVDHLIYGWLFFGIVIFIMFSVGNIWADPIEEQSERTENLTANVPVKPFLSVSVGITAVFAAILLFNHQASRVEIVEAGDFAARLQLSEMENDSWSPKFVGASEVASGSHDGLDYYLAFYGENVQDRELINSENRLFNDKKWSIVSSVSMQDAQLVELVALNGQKRWLAYTYMTPKLSSAQDWKVKLVQALEAVMGQAQPGGYVAISAFSHKGDDSRNKVETEMKRLLSKGYQGVFSSD
ncbi:exosortase A [Bowmanella sp. Y26]|uniref:exosortase A n=1 Tax=Bowmanella yangjiangensis TaxID=2811230 RepID=UPI001BDC410D|nr:exosortase A [Bowmanella yangjiangensis]MBT1064829.1 exosortase A [Bowmanella yangjiangensis]